jgi:hypothetical protein
MRATYSDLYIGGEQLRTNGSQYLLRRQKEPMDVYSERLNRVFYENYIGSIIDWYAATLFRREPLLMFDGEDESGRQFLSQFADDCDLKGSSLTEFFRRVLVDALVQGRSYVLVDFPARREAASSRAHEDALGTSRAYLVQYGASDLINWSLDERGAFEWVLLRTTLFGHASPGDPIQRRETRWAYYDKEWFRIFRRKEQGGRESDIEVVGSGRHGLAKTRSVPLFELKVSEGLWLMNKAGLLQLEHFNKSNALSWALTMGLFAMPVIYSERPWNQVVGESYYIQLGPQDRFGWTEPEGHVYQIASENLTRLKDEIYRVCYLLTQSGQLGSVPQSGLSKQRDYAITQEVLRAYGDMIKDVLKRVLRGVITAREDRLCVDVSGLDDFDMGDFGTELEDAQALLSLGIQSDTFRRAVLKKLALKYLCDVRQETKDQISREIDDCLQTGRS